MFEFVKIIWGLIGLWNIDSESEHVHGFYILTCERESLLLKVIVLFIIKGFEFLEMNGYFVFSWFFKWKTNRWQIIFMINKFKLIILNGKSHEPNQLSLLKISPWVFVIFLSFRVVENIIFFIFISINKLFPTNLILKLIDIWWLFIKVLNLRLHFVSIIKNFFMNEFFAIMIKNIDIKLIFCILVLVSQLWKYRWIFWWCW